MQVDFVQNETSAKEVPVVPAGQSFPIVTQNHARSQLSSKEKEKALEELLGEVEKARSLPVPEGTTVRAEIDKENLTLVFFVENAGGTRVVPWARRWGLKRLENYLSPKYDRSYLNTRSFSDLVEDATVQVVLEEETFKKALDAAFDVNVALKIEEIMADLTFEVALLRDSANVELATKMLNELEERLDAVLEEQKVRDLVAVSALEGGRE